MLKTRKIAAGLEGGDDRTAERLLPLVYQELRRLAAHKLAGEASSLSFQTSDLVHESYLRVRGKDSDRQWNNPFHFLAIAADEMRRILIDRVRRKNRLCHGGGVRPLALEQIADPEAPAAACPWDEVLQLEEALTALAAIDPSAAELVRLRFFAGLTLEETAAALGISRATASRRWTFARAWLYDHVRGAENMATPSADAEK